MKFAKYLEENCIPEWKAAYFDYKKGKKLIKRAEVQDSNAVHRRGRTNSPSTMPLVRRIGRQGPSNYGSTNTDRTNNSTDQASNEQRYKLQPHHLLDKSDTEDQNVTRPPATFSTHESLAPERPGNLLLENVSGGNTIDSHDIELVPKNEAQETFYNFVDQQIRKIDDFYVEREAEAGKRLGELRSQLQEMKDRKKLLSSRRLPTVEDRNRRSDYTRSLVANVRSLFSYADVDLLNSHPISDDPNIESATQMLLTYRVARRRLRIAIQEFYHSLELLQSYRSMNRTALTKVLKKFDKTVKAKSGPQYLYVFNHKTYIGTSSFLDKIMRDSEDVYAKYYYNGDRKHALAALRTKERTEDYRFTMLRIGICAGLSVALGLEGLVRSQVNFAHGVERAYLLQIWASLFFLIFMSLLFGINCYIWSRNKVNYVFIFEYNRFLPSFPFCSVFSSGCVSQISFQASQIGIRYSSSELPL
ncbi:protein of unknown function [Taphrina deformans PYCC 5710]|uniref:SPX domain-containing protein n=1 Tax=Taphrina deformans (strain PYCC 5710 / ATCC 11124 / CBS 356.35 / IMI 108563 / JCM 9778 / NBRC 8474) TaxID=1097556 RepID=R4XKV7_TAPDE|nr:protein of unknown function [Taphrina deformans PYCC 5710]|eukprot:CCG83949.1 protein of unknown function [Taphrina deformans PYCC 5710]